MQVTNQLVSINFTDLPGTYPTTWDLSPTYPNGALDPTHITARTKSTNQSWTPWGPVTAFDINTNIATFTLPGSTVEQVEFRRSTPRYSVYLDPLLPSSRVSAKNLQANADQGLYTAIEWAAQFGIDAQAPLVAAPGEVPNTLGLQQQTQNYWVEADYSPHVWDFSFAGGYIERSHVKVQVLLDAGWVGLSIDTADGEPQYNYELREDGSYELDESGLIEAREGDTDPNDANTSPFRFIGPYQLYLDFTTLGEVPQAIIIYRHTPRSMKVSSLPDRARITAPGMDPSARHALFVAVEIGEQLSQYQPPCDCLTSDQVEVSFTSETDTLIYLTQYQAFQDSHTTGIPVIAIGGTFDPAMKGDAITLSQGNLHASVTGTGPGAVLTTNKWYGPGNDKASVVEFTIISGSAANYYVGAKLVPHAGYPNFDGNADMQGWPGVTGYDKDGTAFTKTLADGIYPTYTEYGPFIPLVSGDVIGVLAYNGASYFVNGVHIAGVPFLENGPHAGGVQSFPVFGRRA